MTVSILSIYCISCKSVAHGSTGTRDARERRHHRLSLSSEFATNEIMAGPGRPNHTSKRVDEICVSRDLLGQAQPHTFPTQ